MSDPGYPTVAPPPVITTVDPPPPTTTTTKPPETTTSPDRTTTRETPPPITTTEGPLPETTTATPYTTQYITTVSVITITTLVPHTIVISGAVTTVYSMETTTSLQPTLIPDPRQPPPPWTTIGNRNGIRAWQIGLVVAIILILLALCLAAVILSWFRKRRQELRDQEDKVVGSREPWNDPATAAAVMMGPSSGGGGGASGIPAGVLHPSWHEYNKEAASMIAATGRVESLDGGYRHVHRHYPDTRYGPNGKLMLVGYTDPYAEDTSDYLSLGYLGHGHAFNGSEDYGLDYAMAGSEMGGGGGGGGAEVASYGGSLAGDHPMFYSGSLRYPIPPQHQVSFNHPQGEPTPPTSPTSPVSRASYEDDYHAAVAQRQQQSQQQSRGVYYPQPPRTSTSGATTSRQLSHDEFGMSSGTEATTEEGADDYRLNLERFSKVEHRRQSPHALLMLGQSAGDRDELGEAVLMAPPVEGSMSSVISEGAAGGQGKDGGHGDKLKPGLFGTSSEAGSDQGADGGGGHERGMSTPGSETAAAWGYLDKLRVK
ncbi:hypothetical protein BGW39_004153 [Mortierella sp. 14UC]|nr:hypothetical protein BGW39_004153 [Mortierella sp. 14UC]